MCEGQFDAHDDDGGGHEQCLQMQLSRPRNAKREHYQCCPQNNPNQNPAKGRRNSEPAGDDSDSDEDSEEDSDPTDKCECKCEERVGKIREEDEVEEQEEEEDKKNTTENSREQEGESEEERLRRERVKAILATGKLSGMSQQLVIISFLPGKKGENSPGTKQMLCSLCSLTHARLCSFSF